MVTAASAFSCASSWESSELVDALKRPSFCRKVVVLPGLLKLRFPSSPRPEVELHTVFALVSGLQSWKWTVCKRSIPAVIETTAGFGSLSFDLRELCLAGEASKFVSDLENWRWNAGSNTCCGFGALYAFFVMTSLWDDFRQTSQCATNFWICFSWLVRQKRSDKVRL